MLVLIVARQLMYKDVLTAVVNLSVSRGPPTISGPAMATSLSQPGTTMFRTDRREEALHRARISMYERLK
jgi:hypothetical protein